MFTIISITPHMSLGDAVQRYLKTLVSLNKYSESGRYGRAYTLGFLGPLAAVRLRDLSRSQIVAWRDALAMMRGRRGARLISLQNNELASLGAFFTWCAERCDALVNLPLLAGVRAPNELSAHGLRRTFAEHAYEAGFSFEELASDLLPQRLTLRGPNV